MSRVDRLLVVVAVVALAGCAGLAGDTTDTPVTTPNPSPEPTPSQTPTPESTSTPAPTPTPTPTPTYDRADVGPFIDDPDGVNVTLYQREVSPDDLLYKGTLTLFNENETVVTAHHANEDGPRVQFDNLDPGAEYRLHFHSDAFDHYPPINRTFDPGQTDRVNVTAFFEWPNPDTFEWQIREIWSAFVDDGVVINENELLELERTLQGFGKYDDGNWFEDISEADVTGDGKWPRTQGVSINGTVYTHYDSWRKIDKGSYNPNYQPAFSSIRDGVLNGQISLQYVGTTELNDSYLHPAIQDAGSIPDEINGTEVLVYDVNRWGYSEWAGVNYNFDDADARMYVDAETKQVLRWEATERLTAVDTRYTASRGVTPSILVYDFFNHDGDIDVSPDDYEPFADDETENEDS